MGVYDRAKRLDDRLSDSETLYRVKELLDLLLVPVLVLLGAVLYLEFFVPLSHAEHAAVIRVEQLILAYFVLELLVDLGIYEDNREFLRDRWLDMLLILPFLTVIRSVTGALRLLKGAKAAKSVKAVKPAKTAKVAKVGEAARLTEAGRAMRGGQHASKVAKKARDIITRD